MASPLEILNRDKQDRWTVLADVPAWEEATVEQWIRNLLIPVLNDEWGRRTLRKYQYSIIRTIEKRNRIIISDVTGLETGNGTDLMRGIGDLVERGEYDYVILFIELLIKWLRDEHHLDDRLDFGEITTSVNSILGMLEASLRNGSKWTIVNEKNAVAGLVERVSPELVEAAKSINNKHLADAWNLAFGVTPNPKAAIEHAQAALESVASSNGLTQATTSVYGTLMGDIKTHKSSVYTNSAKSEFDLNKVLIKAKDGTVDLNDVFAEWFLTGMDLIQKSNPLRHQSATTKGYVISDETGKQAVLIATVLASLIEGGHFARIGK